MVKQRIRCKIKANGIFFGSKYFLWYDSADIKANRTIGFEQWSMNGQIHSFICLWYFNIGWCLNDIK